MFLLNPKYYKPLCELLKKRNKDDSLKIWAYSRMIQSEGQKFSKWLGKLG